MFASEITFGVSPYQGLIDSFGEEGMQLVEQSKSFNVTTFRTCSIGGIGTCELGLCCNFSNAGKFRCLYRYYGSCVPSSPKEC